MHLFAHCDGCATVTVAAQPSDCVAAVKQRLLSLHRLPLAPAETWLSCCGRPCRDEAFLSALPLSEGGSVHLHARLRGGGGDGGATGAESRASYLEMYAGKKVQKTNPAEARLALWTQCRLSGERLRPPCCADELGSLFNKDAVVEALVTKAMPKGLGHITSLKHLINLQLTPTTHPQTASRDAVAAGAASTTPPNEADFCCPVTGTQMNGMASFVVLQPSGLVVSERALKQSRDTVEELAGGKGSAAASIPLNPPIEDALLMREALLAKRAAAKAKKDNKKAHKVSVSAAAPDAAQPAAETVVITAHANGAGEKRRSADISVAAVAAFPTQQVKAKKFKATDLLPAGATESVWSSLFTGGKVSKETYGSRCNSARGMRM
ncbi:hypothetical protein WJX73_000679 [Symbiochloris irregularis]|uniref:Ubiquitin-like domain-containing protein n=1 Tax=Symbiochloris irregularis TaxID=706552 RepID=A0AAW1PZ95_9CHLO